MKSLTLPVVAALTICILTLALPLPACADEKPVWVDATGEAYLGDVDTLNEVKDRAKRDAGARAIEIAVGIFIKSHTLVSNNQIAEDLMYASVRGKISKIKIVREGWDDKERNLWKVNIKALVEPVFPEKGQGLQIKASLSKTELKEGDNIRIYYQANRNCYVYIFSVASDGSVTLLLPNSVNREHFAVAGKTYEFPQPESQVKLNALLLPDYRERIAEEKVKLIATIREENLLPLGFQEGMFKVYDARSTGMVSDLVKRLNRIEPSEWTETSVVYTIHR